MTDDELRARHLRSQRHFYDLFTPAAGGHLVELDAGVRAAVAPSVPHRSLFNAVNYGDEAALIAAIPALAQLYDDAGVLAWTVWVRPGHDDAAQALAEAGHALDADPELMAASLEEIDLERGTELRWDEGTWEEVGLCNDAAYGIPPTFVAPLAGLGDDPRRYVARDDDGNAVACVLSSVSDGDCEITLVATRPEARGRGLSSELMRAALRDARNAGATSTTLEATKLGQPVYERLGYRSLGALQMWERRKPG